MRCLGCSKVLPKGEMGMCLECVMECTVAYDEICRNCGKSLETSETLCWDCAVDAQKELSSC